MNSNPQKPRQSNENIFKRMFKMWCRIMRPAGFPIGSVFILLSIAWTIQTTLFIQHALRAEGSIVQMIPTTNGDGEPEYIPVFQFQSSDGATHALNSAMSSAPPAFRVGDRVNILYKTANPNEARINTPFELWFLPGVFGGIGLVALLLSILLEKQVREQRRSSSNPTTNSYPRIA